MRSDYRLSLLEPLILTMNQAAQKELSRAEYWEQRYAEEQNATQQAASSDEDYEWFKTYAKLKPFLDKHLPSTTFNPKILHLGCGTSVRAKQQRR